MAKSYVWRNNVNLHAGMYMVMQWLRYRNAAMLDTAHHIAMDIIAEEYTYA